MRTPRLAPRVLRPLGEELGVPGAAEGASARRRPRAGRAVRGRVAPVRLVERLARGLRRLRAADARARHREHPGRRGRHPAQARSRRPARRRVHHPAAAARPRAGRRRGAPALDARRPRRARRARLHRPRRGGGVRPRLPVPAPARAPRCSCPACAARTSCRATTTRCACSRARPGSRPPPRASSRPGSAPSSQVRTLHERLFYRPLLSAVAALPEDGYALTSEQAEARLAAIGFADPRGALRHIAALTGGVSRRSQIQRTLLPVMLQWFAEGADPDYGLLTFRRLSDDLGEAYWFLRMLRDSSGAARRLTHVLSSSRFVGILFERIPEAAAWLENDGELRPRIARRAARGDGGDRRAARRRSGCRGDGPADRPPPRGAAPRPRRHPGPDLGRGARPSRLSAITTAALTGALALVHRYGDGIEFGIIAMGRYGGAELGFGSDADVMYVYRPAGVDPEEAQRRAEHDRARAACASPRICGCRSTSTPACAPRARTARSCGRSSRIGRTTSAGRSPGRRRRCCGRAASSAMPTLLDAPSRSSPTRSGTRESIGGRRGARDQADQGARRVRAAAAGRRPGAAPQARARLAVSDVEWFVQLLQLQHAAAVPALRTTSTLQRPGCGGRRRALPAADADRLRAAWLIASRARSAMTLWTAKTADVLPGRPAAARRRLAGPGVPARQRVAARGGLPAHHPPRAAGVRAHVLREGLGADT